jgi:hypothetical protein
MKIKIPITNKTIEVSCPSLQMGDGDAELLRKNLEQNSFLPAENLAPIKKKLRQCTVGMCNHFPDGECRLFTIMDDMGKPLYNQFPPCVEKMLRDIGSEIIDDIRDGKIRVEMK